MWLFWLFIICFIALLAGLIVWNETIDILLLVIGMIGLVTLSIFFVIISAVLDTHEGELSPEPISIEKIYALNDTSETYGSFYLLSGSYEEETYYSYITETKDGGKVLNKVPTCKCVVYEVNDSFRIETYKYTKNFLGIEDFGEKYKIYVPQGSITNEYTIDLEYQE